MEAQTQDVGRMSLEALQTRVDRATALEARSRKAPASLIRAELERQRREARKDKIAVRTRIAGRDVVVSGSGVTPCGDDGLTMRCWPRHSVAWWLSYAARDREAIGKRLADADTWFNFAVGSEYPDSRARYIASARGYLKEADQAKRTYRATLLSTIEARKVGASHARPLP